MKPRLRQGDASPSPAISNRRHCQKEDPLDCSRLPHNSQLAHIGSGRPAVLCTVGLPPRDTERAVHAVVRIMAEGNIPGRVVSWIASASLAGLRKKDDCHRRVLPASGRGRDSSTSHTAKALLASVSEDMTGYFRPTQLGFGTKNG